MIWGKYATARWRASPPAKAKEAHRSPLLSPQPGVGRLYYHLPGASLSEGHYMRSNSWWERDDAFGDMHFKIHCEDNAEELGSSLRRRYAAPAGTVLAPTT